MARAIELAKKGEGFVEPNPMVGCVIVKDGKIVGEGYHKKFGGPHAEIEALNQAGSLSHGSTVYVTLEPCSHLEKKTPPCVPQLIAADVRRVVVAIRDPNPSVNGKGIEQLRKAKIAVESGILENEALNLCAPFLTVMQKRRPWIHAKWAMTMDGKIASRTGSSQWISGEQSLALAHRLRGRMDAIMVGAGTAFTDDPLLTPRWEVIARGELEDPENESFNPLPPGEWQKIREEAIPRTPIRIVLDSTASIHPQSRLVQSAKESPVIIAVGPDARKVNLERLIEEGCEIIELPGRIPEEYDSERRRLSDSVRSNSTLENSVRYPERRRDFGNGRTTAREIYRRRMDHLLETLCDRGVTNLLLEGGGELLGSLFDSKLIDEIHTFIAPKLIGGENAISPIGGLGMADMAMAYRLFDLDVTLCGKDVYIRGRVKYPS